MVLSPMGIPPSPPPPPKQTKASDVSGKAKTPPAFSKPFLIFAGLSAGYFLFLVAQLSIRDQGKVATEGSGERQSSQTSPAAEPLPSKDDWRKLARDNEIKLRWRCEDALKDRLKDPRSYQPNEIKYAGPLGNRGAVSVLIDYTAKNSLGGSNRGAAICLADENAEVIDIITGS
jgi:hypothetical protein